MIYLHPRRAGWKQSAGQIISFASTLGASWPMRGLGDNIGDVVFRGLVMHSDEREGLGNLESV